jgi:hypothetical protein
MAGRGMGIATKGGGCVGSGPKNRMISETSKTSGPVMMAKGGMADKKGRAMKMKSKDASGRAMMADGGMAVSPRKKMAMGMMGGGMMRKYRKGGMACN